MLKIFENEQLVAEAIAKEMQRALTVENPVFCLASGSTPAKSYDLFAQDSKDNPLIKALKIVSLDEWVGIGASTVGSCYQMLDQDLFQKINLKSDQIVFFDGTATDLEAECAQIDDFIAQNPITFSLMGVGMNGHIGLNEPGAQTTLDSSGVVKLSETTKEVAQKYFEKEMTLEEGITLSVEQLLDSEKVIVVITGEHKADIVKDIFSDKLRGEYPREIFPREKFPLPAQRFLKSESGRFEHVDFYLDQAAAKYLDEGVLLEYGF